MNTTEGDKVYLLRDGRELTGTGFGSIDNLLSDVVPETLAAALALVKATTKDPSLGERFVRCLTERLQPYRDGDLDDRDERAEIAPTEKWLAFADALDVTGVITEAVCP